MQGFYLASVFIGGSFFILDEYLDLFRVYNDSISGLSRLGTEYVKIVNVIFKKLYEDNIEI